MPRPEEFDEDFDYSVDDEGAPAEEEGAPAEEGKEEDDDWFMPGLYKTREEAIKAESMKTQKIKQMEKKLAEVKPPQEPTPPAQPTQLAPDADEVDALITRLGITEDEAMLNPVETQKKILREFIKTTLPEKMTPLANGQNSLKGQIVKDKLKLMYPDFDVDRHEQKLADMVKSTYSTEHINKNMLGLLSNAVQKLGGKKGNGVRNKGGVVFSETPNGQSIPSHAKTIADGIRQGISKAKVGNADIFK